VRSNTHFGAQDTSKIWGQKYLMVHLQFGKHFLIPHVVKALDKLVFGSTKILKGEQDEEK